MTPRAVAEVVQVLRPWAPPRGTVIQSVCARHHEIVLTRGAVGPNGEVSHGLCSACTERFRRGE